jgi:hypothetical protein
LFIRVSEVKCLGSDGREELSLVNDADPLAGAIHFQQIVSDEFEQAMGDLLVALQVILAC